jgi:hypothetical protein
LLQDGAAASYNALYLLHVRMLSSHVTLPLPEVAALLVEDLHPLHTITYFLFEKGALLVEVGYYLFYEASWLLYNGEGWV